MSLRVRSLLDAPALDAAASKGCMLYARFATTRWTAFDWRLGSVAALLLISGLGCDGASETTSSLPSGSQSAPNGAARGSEPAAEDGALPASKDAPAAAARQPKPDELAGSAGSGGGVAILPPTTARSIPAAVGGSPQPSAAGIGADTQPTLRAEPDYREIIASDWELAPGAETYLCLRKTADADLYINQFRTVLPIGTHHIGLYVSTAPDKANGTINCNLLETGDRLLVGGGPGSRGFSLPPGVALRVDKGNQLLLQAHLFNTTEGPLRGRSIVQGVVLPKEAVEIEADALSAQLLSLVVPPGRSRAPGRCTFDRAQTLVAFGAHMHQTGRHMKVVLHRAKGGDDQVLHDGDFDVAEQLRYPLDSIEVAAGDYVDYECTYENTTERTIYWGESSLDEMCLVNFYRFPAGGETLCWL